MKVLKISDPGKVVLGEGEKPAEGQGEVLVKLKYVGFCGSDLSTYLGKNPMVQYPRVPGHEISGIIDYLHLQSYHEHQSLHLLTPVKMPTQSRVPISIL